MQVIFDHRVLIQETVKLAALQKYGAKMSMRGSEWEDVCCTATRLRAVDLVNSELRSSVD